jgi:hypothetical protein
VFVQILSDFFYSAVLTSFRDDQDPRVLDSIVAIWYASCVSQSVRDTPHETRDSRAIELRLRLTKAAFKLRYGLPQNPTEYDIRLLCRSRYLANIKTCIVPS